MVDSNWRLFGNSDVISTLYDVIIPCYGLKRKYLWTYSSFNTLTLKELQGGRRWQIYLTQKIRPLLNVKI